MSDNDLEMVECPRCVSYTQGWGCNLCALRLKVPAWVAVEHALLRDAGNGFSALDLGLRWRGEK